VLEAAGYTSIVANSDGHAERERVILERMKERQVDGLILATAQRDDATIIRTREEGVPLVLVNRTVESTPVEAVVIEDRAGIRLAVEHLTALGHRRIAHLAGPQDVSTGHRRREGFLAVLRDLGMDATAAPIEPCAAYTEEEGRRGLLALLDRGTPFTALVAANDLLALGCYDALEERGLRCPEHLSVTGFNDMPMVGKLSPPLTTVHIPLYDMGAEAARMLLAQLQGAGVPPRTVSLQPRLIVRKSTGPVPAAR
jgi:LacI family transcriptional regulator